MANEASWPTNHYGTSWRRAFTYFDQRDEELVEEAIETIDPLMITVRFHSAVIIGFENVADLIMMYLADTLPSNRTFDNEGMRVLIDPCTDTAALRALMERYTDAFDFSILGVGIVDFADEATHQALVAALSDRRGRCGGEMPSIEF